MINLSIQDPIIPDTVPTNVYVLKVLSYHGDGDQDETTELSFRATAVKMEKLHMYLDILEAYIKAGKPHMITTEEWAEFIKQAKIDTSSVPYIEDCVSEMLAWDVTNDGQYLTTFQGYNLVFFDFNGVQRNVQVEHTDGSN